MNLKHLPHLMLTATLALSPTVAWSCPGCLIPEATPEEAPAEQDDHRAELEKNADLKIHGQVVAVTDGKETMVPYPSRIRYNVTVDGKTVTREMDVVIYRECFFDLTDVIDQLKHSGRRGKGIQVGDKGTFYFSKGRDGKHYIQGLLLDDPS